MTGDADGDRAAIPRWFLKQSCRVKVSHFVFTFSVAQAFCMLSHLSLYNNQPSGGLDSPAC